MLRVVNLKVCRKFHSRSERRRQVRMQTPAHAASAHAQSASVDDKQGVRDHPEAGNALPGPRSIVDATVAAQLVRPESASRSSAMSLAGVRMAHSEPLHVDGARVEAQTICALPAGESPRRRGVATLRRTPVSTVRNAAKQRAEEQVP